MMNSLKIFLLCLLPVTVCSYAYLPNSGGSQSAAEKVCRSLPYRTAYIGSKCFIALASDNSDEDEYGSGDASKICRNILKGDTDSHFKNYDFKPELAEVKCDALLDEIKRSFILKPKVKYTVKNGPNDVSYVVNDDGDYKNQGSNKGILCEFSSVEKCPEGYELFRHSCYKYFDQKVDFPEAKNACEQKEGWLPKIRDDEVNRYIASVAFRNKNSRTWIGASGAGEDWKEVDDKQSVVVYFRWLVYNLSKKAKNAVMMTDIQRENSKWFGYWEDTNEEAKHSYICAVKPTIGKPNLELIPDYSDTFKA